MKRHNMQVSRAARLCVTATAAAALLVPALAASAEAAPAAVGASACGKTYPKGYWWTYPKENVNFRSGPGTKYTSHGLVLKYEGVEVKCKAKVAGWMRIYVLNGQMKGRTGWVASKYIQS
ncbi:SH3 domain-containing protein [Streptomyces californicus]|uniref:SH3 domain-containing protein n=1 Tax=Streptomyces californicus TaxID=67351 RepID=UPI00296E6B73|nr:SH3 domain-containing protein [Streptomyces californicus]MDW4912593.1 SH3 domain-containing protein [Streptomyces californicus]